MDIVSALAVICTDLIVIKKVKNTVTIGFQASISQTLTTQIMLGDEQMVEGKFSKEHFG